MPQKDKTGPEGKGQMTGRGQGFCIDFEIPEIESTELGRMFGRGFRGQGRGFSRGFRFHIRPREFTKEEQIELLKNQKKAFEERVLAIGKQLKEYEKPLKKLGKPLEKKKVRGKK